MTAAVSLALLLSSAWVPLTLAQSASEAPAPATAPPSSLNLTPEKVSHLKTALAALGFEVAVINLVDAETDSMIVAAVAGK